MLAVTNDCLMIDETGQRAIGAAASLLMKDAQWKGSLAETLTEAVVPASKHGKLAFFVNFERVPVGFVAWAHLSPETESRLIGTLDPWLHLSEWNEGPTLWIRCLYLPREWRREGIRLCLSQLFPDDEAVRFIARRKGVQMVAEMDRAMVQRWSMAG